MDNLPQGSNKETPSLRDLFPTLSDQQLSAVEDTFHGYLEIAWKIYERLEREQPEFFDSLRNSP
jgi:hypothetical protein